jgi:hypothetical protein
MVQVKAIHERMNKENKPFITLELTGDIELVQSQETGRFYATARRCIVSSTFTKEQALQFIGTKMPGSIVREACDSYEFKLPETGEEIILSHRWTYVPEQSVLETNSHAQPKKMYMEEMIDKM